MYTIINFLDFDSIIVKRNINRYLEKDDIDLMYIKNATSTNCINSLNELYNKSGDKKLKEEVYCCLKTIKYQLKIAKQDFRNLNISKIN